MRPHSASAMHGRSLLRRLLLGSGLLTMWSTTTETVQNIIALAFVMLQRRARSRSERQAKAVQGVISRRQLQWYVWLEAVSHRWRGCDPRFVGTTRGLGT